MCAEENIAAAEVSVYEDPNVSIHHRAQQYLSIHFMENFTQSSWLKAYKI